MKYVIFFISLLCISCTLNVAKPEITKKDFVKTVEQLKETQKKVEELSNRLDALEKKNENNSTPSN